MTPAVAGAGRFRALHHADQPLVLPNAWDHASAAALAAAGFPAVGTTSLGVAAANGLPDGHNLARAETIALVDRLRGLPCLLTVDIEGGFGDDPAEVADLTARLAEAGAVGVNLEDGRPDGTLADVAGRCALIAAIKRRVPDLFVNARTDTYWLNTNLPDTVDRARAYVAAGADGIFVPAVADAEDIRTLVGEVGTPLNVLFLPGRHTVRDLAELGVRRISTGSLLFRAALRATVDTALAVRDGQPVSSGVPSYAEVQGLVSRSEG